MQIQLFNNTTAFPSNYPLSTRSTNGNDKDTHPKVTESPDVTTKDSFESSSESTPEEQKVVEQLKARDMEVRAHEQAHMSAGGQYVTGGPTFTYQKGPDGNQYAVGGEVQIDVSKVEGNPEATIQKTRAAQSAANAPATHPHRTARWLPRHVQ